MNGEMRTLSKSRVIEIEPERSQISAADVLEFLKRYRAVILLVWLFCVLSTYATLLFLTEQFETKASLIVKLGRENLDPPATVRNTVFSTGIRHEEVMSEIEFLKSPALLQQVVDEMGMEAFRDHRVAPPHFIGKVRFYAKAGLRFVKNQCKEVLYALSLQKRLNEKESALVEVSDDLSATWQKESDVIEVTLRMPDPVLAKTVLQRLLSDYQQKRIEVKKGSGIDDFLVGESTKSQRALAEAEARESQWKATHGVSSAKDQRGLYLQQIRELTSERFQTTRDLQTALMQRDSLEKLIASTPDTLNQSHQEVPSPSLSAYKQRLTTLKAERAELLDKYNEASTVVANKDDEISRLKKLIADEQTTETSATTYAVNPVSQELEKKLHETEIAIAGLGARDQAQGVQLAAMQSRLAALDVADNHLQDLERSRSLLEAKYMTLAKRTQDADLSGKLDSNQLSNVSIITAPWSDPVPVYPKKMLLMYVSLGVGLILGLALAMLLNYLDDDIHDAKQVQAILGAPCLGAVALGHAE